MKALRKYEKGIAKFRVEEVDIPKPGKGEVLVEVQFAGICGTDMHIYHDTYNDAPPMTIGHEFSGVVVEVGIGVSDYKKGDKVVSETNVEYCGSCYLCKSGRFCLCNNRKALGQQVDGVFAKFAVIPARELFKLPENVSMVGAALSEPLSCVVHAVMQRSNIQAGDNVIVSGPGPIGLMAVMIAKMSGAHVLLTGTTIDAERLKLGVELGADSVVDVMKQDLQEVVQEYTDGKGVDVVLECSGVGVAVRSGIAALKKTGIFTQIGLFGKDAILDLNAFCFKEINFYGCLSKTDWSWRKTMQLLATGDIPLDKLVSHKFKLEEWKKAFEISENKTGMKIVFEP
ncbi:MAG: zinc-binding dehydrogenase [Spirochaetales bacterium]|uniref:Zinc-binding dehydrogenase n=1 Tax=Candidatus Thalassospirochaeta sargassi TaxID=3119039 RepID=A0AAJ1ICW5_9SPIO|nr:zinc-binding dehydrogenase [Spirochaetales bacterium]